MNGHMIRSPFLEEVKASIRVRHYSIRTEQAYVGWIKRFILFQGKRHPREMGEKEVGEFLTYLAVDRRVSPGTQTVSCGPSGNNACPWSSHRGIGARSHIALPRSTYKYALTCSPLDLPSLD
jgi:hypothetical protein